MSLPRTPFGCVCHLVNGKAFKPTDWSAAGAPIIRIQNLNGADKPFNYWAGALDKQVLVKTGDLLLAWSGTPGTSFGAHIWSGPNGILNQHIFRCDLNEKAVSKEWARIAASIGLIEQAHGGVGLQHVTRGMVGALEIPLPPACGAAADCGGAGPGRGVAGQAPRRLTRLDSLTQSLFLDLFGDPAFNVKKWPRVQLVGVCGSPDDIKCGPFGTQLSRDEFRTEGVPLWGIKNVNKLFELPTHEFLEPRTAKRLMQYSMEPGDIVMTRKGTVGNCAVYPDTLPLGIMHSDLLRLRLNRQTCEPIFLAHQLHHSRDVEGQLALISGGAVMPGINVTRLKSLEVLVSPIKLQREFARRVTAVERLNTVQRASLSELDALFATLQHRAFLGEL